MASSTGAGGGTGSPCGACKFLRRKCAADCVFAPYFCSEQGPARFAAIHKVFGASNVSKLLLHVPVHDRCEAVVTIAYEAQARIRDPVYGCVSHIFALQQQVAYLQAQVMQVKAQLAHNLINNMDYQSSSSRNHHNAENNIQWPGSCHNNINMGPAGGLIGGLQSQFAVQNYMNLSNISPQSSLDSININNNDGINNNNNNNNNNSMREIQSSSDEYVMTCPPRHSRKRHSQTDLSELQALALRMMKNENC
ncbi:hypothetical protein ABFX02_14G207400 [Erythranthe guttata]